MKIYFDFEFNERDIDNKPTSIHPLSLGAVADSPMDVKFYQQFCRKDLSINPWVQQNVLPNIDLTPEQTMPVYNPAPNNQLAVQDVLALFVRWLDLLSTSPVFDGKFQFIGYYCSYDWVILCRMFGSMMDLDPRIHMNPIDLKCISQAIANNGNEFEFEDVPGHNALMDAEGIRRDAYRLFTRHSIANNSICPMFVEMPMPPVEVAHG